MIRLRASAKFSASSEPPAVYQDLNMCHCCRLKEALFCWPIRMKRDSKRTSGTYLLTNYRVRLRLPRRLQQLLMFMAVQVTGRKKWIRKNLPLQNMSKICNNGGVNLVQRW